MRIINYRLFKNRKTRFNKGLKIILTNTKRFLKKNDYEWVFYCVFHLTFGLPVENLPKEKLASPMEKSFQINLSPPAEDKILRHMHKFIKIGLSDNYLISFILDSISEQIKEGHKKKEVEQNIRGLQAYFKKIKNLGDLKKFLIKDLTYDYKSVWELEKKRFLALKKQFARLTNKKETLLKQNTLFLKEWQKVRRKIIKEIIN